MPSVQRVAWAASTVLSQLARRLEEAMAAPSWNGSGKRQRRVSDANGVFNHSGHFTENLVQLAVWRVSGG
jgi:hypothetical protein